MGVGSTLLVVLAVSLDGVAAGWTYGMRGIRIPCRSAVVIGALSSSMAAVAVFAGSYAGRAVGPLWASRLGALILMGLGAALLLQSWAGERAGGRTEEGEGRLLSLRLKPLGLVIEVWRDPGAADLDRSGRLEMAEACLLGLSLAFDAFGAGLGVALSGYAWLYPCIVGPFQVLMVSMGRVLAGREGWRQKKGFYRYLPAGILMLMGLIKWS